MARIAVFNQKGGVAKTTTALNLAGALQRTGKQTLLIDMDPQAHLTQIHGHVPESAKQSLFGFYQDDKPLYHLEVEWTGLGHLIPSHKELIKVDSAFGKGQAILNKLRHGLDVADKLYMGRHTLIDCCPYLGTLSLNAIFAADLIIIPISSDFLSLKGAKKVADTLAAIEPVLKRRIERRYLLTRFDRRRGMTFQVQNKAKQLFGNDLLETVISENVSVAESPEYGIDIFRHQPNSTGAQNYLALLIELAQKWRNE
ncbi:ParA family protein [Methylobacillus gramineus]|uniref:ParA family protein n=1 Tax=Methylobacillus gramineus TaxID=755169 RepID=UPI001CFFFF0B|nr:ParA family protein [Methylobacillus gramineus]MCB5183588.1 ParA family protein [Methylobacillus gramineus]